jgi:hypothetical protein
MYNIKKFKKDYPSYSQLTINIFKSLCEESVDDVTKYGMAGGFSGFIYYDETIAFWKRNRQQITALLEETNNSIGENKTICEFVASFNGLQTLEDKNDIAKAIYGKFNDEYTQIYNALTWFAVEEICNMLVNGEYNESN